ncbi:MAG: hypothetical protein AB8B69_17195 [Chitinophagales bacterium]
MKKNKLLFTGKLSLFFVFLSFQGLLQAQSSFSEGLVVTAEKDTLRGYINDRDWDFHPNSIMFKASKSDKGVRYTPNDLLMVKTESGKHFETFTAEVNKTKRSDYSYDSKVNVEEKRVFMQPIIKGEMNLYLYQSPDLEMHFFVQKGGADLMELLEVQYKEKRNRREMRVVDKRYLKDLKRLTYDCEVLESKFKGLKLEIDDISEYVREYNTCKSALEKDFTNMYKKSGVKWEFALFSGINRHKLDFSVINGPYGFMEQTNFPANSSVIFGGGINIGLNKWNKRWAIGFEILSYQQEFNQQFSGPGIGTTTEYSTHFENRIRVSNLFVRYYLSNRKLRPFIKLGVGSSSARGTNKNEVIGSGSFIKKYEDIEEIDQSTTRLTFGTGFKFSKFFLEGRYSFGKGLEPIPQLDTKSSELSLLLGLLL